MVLTACRLVLVCKNNRSIDSLVRLVFALKIAKYTTGTCKGEKVRLMATNGSKGELHPWPVVRARANSCQVLYLAMNS